MLRACGGLRARYGSCACDQYKRGDLRTPLVGIALELKQITNVQLLLCSRYVCNTQGNFCIERIALDGCTARLSIESFHRSKHQMSLQVGG